MTTAALFLTSHDQLGDTGRRTGWYLSEASHAWKVFTDAGWDVAFVSPGGGRPAMDGVDLGDPIQAAFVSVYGETGPETTAAASVDPAAFDAVFYVGGHGSMWDFPSDENLQAISRSVWERGGVISAVCHGPAGLVDLTLSDGSYLVAGRHVSAFTDDEERAVGLDTAVPFLLASTLVARGAIHEPADNWQAKVVADDRLVTGQNPASAIGVAEAVVARVAQSMATA